MTLLIIANYRKDHQESMSRFAHMLEIGYKSENINAIIIRPFHLFGYLFKQTSTGLGKWVGYVDKWILTPLYLILIRLFYSLRNEVYYHIADHSNAPYIFWLPQKKTIITCHDVLAIRGALGDRNAWCRPSIAGIWLQRWILVNLLKAKLIGAVSKTTLDQLILLDRSNKSNKVNWRVIYNGFNSSFYKPNTLFVQTNLEENKIDNNRPFLLHVGSALPRKNRIMLIKMVIELGDDFIGNIVFAGKPLESEIINIIQQNKLNDRVHVIVNPNNDLLLALYAACDAFIFPSWSEGFGWPVIEAQACGAPVIASNLQPMPEIAGKGALFASPDNALDFANAYRELKISTKRKSIIEAGFRNTHRFSSSVMIKEYLSLFQY